MTGKVGCIRCFRELLVGAKQYTVQRKLPLEQSVEALGNPKCVGGIGFLAVTMRGHSSGGCLERV